MRTLFDQGSGLNFESSVAVNNTQQALHHPAEEGDTLGRSFVTLEINVEALQRLIDRHALAIDEIQCVDQRSKNMVRHAVLAGLLEAKRIRKT